MSEVDKRDLIPEEFILHNCYKDVMYEDGETACESEVSPFAFLSYLQYPFFQEHNEYTAYLPRQKFESARKTRKYANKINKNEIVKKFIKRERESETEDYPQIEIWERKQISTTGCFFTKETCEETIESFDEYRKGNNNKSLDLSADIITSIKHPIKNCFELKDKTYDKVDFLLKINRFEDAFNIITEYTNNKNICEGLIKAIEKFCCVVGTIGNMMPIPEHTNPFIKDDSYYYKLKHVYHPLFQTNICVKFDSAENLVRHYWLFNELHYTQNNYGYKQFIEHFCLQDFFKSYKDNKKNVIVPTAKYNYLLPDCEDITSWIEWFNTNTKLILKRGARIYLNGKDPKEECIDALFENVIDWSREVNKSN